MYQLTPLEQQVKELYQSFNIYQPDQIDMLDMAFKLNIWVHIAPIESKAREFKGLRSMVIDSRLSEPEQWEEFAHELSHLLNHSCSQLNIPKNFIEFQETKANNFAMHFCVPTFMILELGVPYTWSEAIFFVMDTFNVTETFARKRLEHFNKQVIGFEFYETIRQKLKVAENKMESIYTTKNRQTSI